MELEWSVPHSVHYIILITAVLGTKPQLYNCLVKLVWLLVVTILFGKKDSSLRFAFKQTLRMTGN